jgi:pimeloyl-ACP methyl ester carboxylesterase
MPDAPLAFPPPSGRHGIGTVTHHWVDERRREVLSDRPGDHRELMVQIWYPAQPSASAPRAPYLPDADDVGPALAGFLGVPPSALDPLARTTTNAVAHAPIEDGADVYPVVIVLVGIKGSYRQIQTFQVEELVSHGYVVAAIDQPYSVATVVFPDGRRVPYDARWDPPHSAFMDAHIPHLARDVSFTIDRLAGLAVADPDDLLTGRLDLERVGVVGHSFGAVVGAEAARIDGRVRAAMLEEGFMPGDVVRDGLAQPVMLVTRPAASMRVEREAAGGWPESDIDETRGTMRSVYEHLRDEGYFVEIAGSFHLDMTDAGLLAPYVAWPGLAGPIGPERVHRIVNAYSVAFFDRELRHEPAPLLDGPHPTFPEVTFESRHRAR